MPAPARKQPHGTWGAVWSMLAFGAIALITIFGVSPTTGVRVPSSANSTVPLLDDNDSNHPLFDPDDVKPGWQSTRCIEISYDGNANPTGINLKANSLTDVAGATSLADYLNVAVKRGDGSVSGSCIGFTNGVDVYSGTRTLRSLSTGSGIDTGWAPHGVTSKAFQITVSLPSSAPQSLQGAKVRAELLWGAVAPSHTTTPQPSTTPPTTPTTQPTTTSPTAVPSTTPPATPSVAPTGSPSASPSRSASASPTPSQRTQTELVPRSHEPTPSVSSGGGGSSPIAKVAGAIAGAGRALAKVVGATAKTVVDMAARTAPHSPFLLAAMGVMFLFLLAQDRFDRRDPKLALAPVSREPYLTFTEILEFADEEVMDTDRDRAGGG